MQGYCKWMDGLSRLGKIIFCIWILDIFWAVYRIGRAISKKNWLHLVLAILWVIFAGFLGWLLDLICILLFNHICWFEKD